MVKLKDCNSLTCCLATRKLVGSQCHGLATRNFWTPNEQIVCSQLATCWLITYQLAGLHSLKFIT